MRKSRRLVVYLAASGLLTAGVVWATGQAAHADQVAFCYSNGADASCTNAQTISAPVAVSFTITASPKQYATINYTADCTLNGASATITGGYDSLTPTTDAVNLPFANPDVCTITAKTNLPSANPEDELNVQLNYTTGTSPGPAPAPAGPAPVRPIKGYAGKCVDDNRNSSADRAKIQIWTCSGSDQAESWTYHNNELIHNGMCMNDQYAGGSGSHVILYSCNGASNELWTSLANGEFVLKAHGGTLCLDDPAYSTRSGTQLIVYTCKDSSNQRWSLP